MNPALSLMVILGALAAQAQTTTNTPATAMGSQTNSSRGLDSGVQARILQFGITTSAIGQTVDVPGDPTGKFLVLAPGTTSLETATNRIPAKIGVHFGCLFQLSGLDPNHGSNDEITVVWTYPPMDKPDGSVSRGFAVTGKARVDADGRGTGWTGYHFQYSYELVPGEWQLLLKYQGNTIASQNFTVFKPSVRSRKLYSQSQNPQRDFSIPKISPTTRWLQRVFWKSQRHYEGNAALPQFLRPARFLLIGKCRR